MLTVLFWIGIGLGWIVIGSLCYAVIVRADMGYSGASTAWISMFVGPLIIFVTIGLIGIDFIENNDFNPLKFLEPK